MYLRNNGYPVVFAHKGETDHVFEAARQLAHRQKKEHGWNSVKPREPYEKWIDALAEPGDRIVIPCAGTAPAAIAAERLWGDDAQYTCIDIEAEAKAAFENRLVDETSTVESSSIDVEDRVSGTQ